MKKQKGIKFENYFNKKIQADSSTFCGFFCILAVLELHFNRKKSLFNTMQLIKNDDKCIKYILKIITENI
jgi:hypothetical protein